MEGHYIYTRQDFNFTLKTILRVTEIKDNGATCEYLITVERFIDLAARSIVGARVKAHLNRSNLEDTLFAAKSTHEMLNKSTITYKEERTI